MKSLLHGLIALTATALTISRALACSTDEDCSLNGVYFQPATRNTGYNRTAEGISSWGGKIVQDPNDHKTFHLILAQFAHNCVLWNWAPYSTIVRATSKSGPEGSYQFDEEIVGTFAHNPTVVYSKADGLHLLFHIGCSVQVPTGCGWETFTCGPGNSEIGESGVSAWSSPDLKNWEFHGQVFQGDANGTWDADTTNPSPFPLWSANHQTSEILMAYRTCIENCADGLELIALASAANYTGPYIRAHNQSIFPNIDLEDPFVWHDKRGDFHMLVHDLYSGEYGQFDSGPNVGKHGYARNWDGEWTYNAETVAYSTYVEFTDGTATNFTRRERPQLFFSDDGEMTPLFLSTGVQEMNTSQSYTFVQPIGHRSYQYVDSLGL